MTNLTQHLGKYQILEELGRGGFGAVYRALDTTLKREVALKILNPALLHEEGWLARFQREAQVIASLDHPRIVAVYEIAEADNRVFIAMKLLRGPSLDKGLAERGALPWADAQRIAREVAEALAYAHAQGVLHRDLKPANVVLDATTGAALTDFGFARIVGDTSLSLSLSGGLVGTPHYLAPELWHNQPASPASDLYALGCILYEMVVGRKAFPGDTSPAVMMAHFQPLALPETWPESTPPGLDAVLRRTLAQHPGDRYPTVAAFAEALATLQADPLATPYAALEAAVAAGEWQKALRLAEDIHAQAPAYRAVAQLLEKARAEIARADLIAQWRAQTESALRAGPTQAARAAAEQWLRLAPGDAAGRAMLAQANIVSPSSPFRHGSSAESIAINTSDSNTGTNQQPGASTQKTTRSLIESGSAFLLTKSGFTQKFPSAFPFITQTIVFVSSLSKNFPLIMRWCLANLAGGVIGGIVGGLASIAWVWGIGKDIYSGIFWGIGIGGAILWVTSGILEWLVLKRYLSKAGWWIVANIVGGVGCIVVAITIASITGPLTERELVAAVQWAPLGLAASGVIAGIVQTLFLASHIRRVGWWMVFNLIGLTVGSVIGWDYVLSGDLGFVLYIVIFATALGIVTAPVLVWLFKNRKIAISE